MQKPIFLVEALFNGETCYAAVWQGDSGSDQRPGLKDEDSELKMSSFPSGRTMLKRTTEGS